MARLTAEQLETFQLMVDTHGERAITVLVSDLKALLSSHADAQRALDAEREKVEELECYRALWKRRDDELTGVLAQLTTLQAQLRQVEGELANEKTAYKKLSEQWNKDNVDLSTFREVENDMKDE